MITRKLCKGMRFETQINFRPQCTIMYMRIENLSATKKIIPLQSFRLQDIIVSSMHSIENIKKVSLVFFIVTGILHLGSSIFIANSLFLKEMSIINKTMDVPFVITGLIYGFSSLRLALTDPQKTYKTLDIILICVIILVLIGLILINLLVPNLKT